MEKSNQQSTRKQINQITMYNQEEVTAFETFEGTDVTKRVTTTNKTKAFKLYQDAEKYAKQKGSYIYDLFCIVTKNGRPSRQFYGYGVPN